MTTRKNAAVTLAAKSVSTADTNGHQPLALPTSCVDGREQPQYADIEAGLQEADRGEFASVEEVRAVFAKYGH